MHGCEKQLLRPADNICITGMYNEKQISLTKSTCYAIIMTSTLP